MQATLLHSLTQHETLSTNWLLVQWERGHVQVELHGGRPGVPAQLTPLLATAATQAELLERASRAPDGEETP